MQSTFLTPNIAIFRAVFRTIRHIQSTLSQATTVTCTANEIPLHLYTTEVHQGFFGNLQRLITEARIHLQNIELSLEEEARETQDVNCTIGMVSEEDKIIVNEAV